MKKNDIRYIAWKKHRDNKKSKLNVKKRRWKKLRKKDVSRKKRNTSTTYLKRDFLPDRTLEVPTHFSIINNSKETINFFDELIKLIYGEVKQRIHLDMRNVTIITVDALIYLLAVIKNMQKEKISYKNPIKGNYPNNKEAYNIFVRSGFLDYMNNNAPVDNNSDISRINFGIRYNQEISKTMCIFAHKHSSLTINETDYLYNSICEMMLNTVQHAYDVDNKLINNWYSYAECDENDLIYMFFDTGEGIPSTIQKKRKFFGLIQEKEADLVSSAFNGEFRTKTKSKNRGRGLVSIKNSIDEDKIYYLSVITNKASNVYEYSSGETIETKNNISGSLTGTLYYWKIRRNNNDC